MHAFCLVAKFACVNCRRAVSLGFGLVVRGGWAWLTLVTQRVAPPVVAPFKVVQLTLMHPDPALLSAVLSLTLQLGSIILQ